ncbi:ABC transporter substrate-binding protein [Paenibacillus alkalitolerans]|uniref:ABC transporter substrate-binding protein n=1 Tax=Paenibacillus alkalitolerans TaxID=2799335 RepID=UPI0018F5F311|nr:sugar ABC transporter substrate-binding protein [Paenibacillus alkalitolerans]
MKRSCRFCLPASLAIILFTALFLQACSSDSKSAGGEPVELSFPTFWVGEDGKTDIVQKIVNDFNAKYEGQAKVVIDPIPDDDVYQTKMKTNLASNQLPDIFTFYYNPVESELYYKSGRLLDLAPIVGDSLKANFGEEVLAAGTYEGKVLAVPLDQMITPFFYNKDLFAQAGITEFPKTWDDLINAAEALKSKGINAFAMGTGENAWSAMLLYSYIVSSVGGPDVYQAGLNDPAFVKGAEILKKLFEFTPKDAVGATYQQYAAHFLNEKAAITVNGPWMISEFQQHNEALPAKIGVAASPGQPSGLGIEGALVSGLGWTMAAKKQDDPKKEEFAAKFIEYFISPENAKQIFLQSGEIFNSTNYELAETDNVDRITQDILAKVNEAPQTYNYFEGMVSSGVKTEFPAALSGLVLGEYTPEQFVERVVKASQQ